MRRMPNGFYRELKKLRDSYGHVEYNRKELAKAARPLLDKWLADGGDAGDMLKDDLVLTILDNVENDENNPLQGSLFSYDAHVALGPNRRVKRGRMNFAQTLRRKVLIDNNLEAQQQGWRIESNWLNAALVPLQGMSATTVREEVLNEDGSPRNRAA